MKIEEIKEVLDSLVQFIDEKSLLGFCNDFEKLKQLLKEFEEWAHAKITSTS